MATPSGGWDMHRLRRLLDEDIISYIMAIKTPSTFANHDNVMLSWNSGGKFLVSGTSEALMGNIGNIIKNKWKMAWDYKGPLRIRHFLWTILKGKLFTNAERWKGDLVSPSYAHNVKVIAKQFSTPYEIALRYPTNHQSCLLMAREIYISKHQKEVCTHNSMI